MSDAAFRDLFDSLPSWVRHAISFGICSGLLVGAFLLFIWTPLENAQAADGRQDDTLKAHQAQLDRQAETLSTLTQTQAVQAATIANMQRLQDRTDTTLNRIEDKIDQMRRGR